ncbi:hypothetical protein ES703_31678 [subsurface metagenome]
MIRANAFGKLAARLTLAGWNLLPATNRRAIKQTLPINRGVIGVITYGTGWLRTTLSEDSKIGEFSQGFGEELILDYIQNIGVRKHCSQAEPL